MVNRSIRKGSQVSGLGLYFQSGNCAYYGGYPYEHWHSHTIAQFEPRRFETARGEVGGFMLSVTGLNTFYFLKDFHDMRCKYESKYSMKVGNSFIPLIGRM